MAATLSTTARTSSATLKPRLTPEITRSGRLSFIRWMPAIITQSVGVPRTAQADAAARAVERMLSERGYRQARVRPSLDTSHDPDRATLVLTVEMGPQTLVQSARVDGTSPLSEPDVLKRLGIAVGQPYRSRDIDTRLDALIDELRARGYY